MVGGLMLDQVDLSAASSMEQAAKAVGAAGQRVRQQQKLRDADASEDVGGADGGAAYGGWVLGGGWDELKWGGKLPDSAWLDEVRRPVCFTS